MTGTIEACSDSATSSSNDGRAGPMRGLISRSRGALDRERTVEELAMGLLQDVTISAVPLDRFVPVLGAERVSDARALAARLREKLAGAAIWNVNSTAIGGGVAEMLPSLLAYARAEGIDTRWVVMQGEPEFFAVTKRLHHALHGSVGAGGLPTEQDRAVYERITSANAADLGGRLGPGDVVILHDPQTAGMAPMLHARGARVIWRCHIGHDRSGPEVESAWAFLAPYLRDVPAYVFSRREYVPPQLDAARAAIVQPSIDAFSPKNVELDEATVRAILHHVGVLSGPAPPGSHPVFPRRDGSPGRVERFADLVLSGPPPSADTPLVVQVSRWDPLKDMCGVMQAFAELVESGRAGRAELVLAGPNVRGVADDPEGPAVYRDVLHAWHELPPEARVRITLATIPTNDVDENAAIINALQRHAAIVVQKSLHEGFGLTVTEAMWKARPVIATRVGGIQDQIVDGETGVLVEPGDRDAFTAALAALLADEPRREAMGRA
ncbi:MAG: glycosyltransferase, partial [Myxococcota bacterium]|nr:glycosyltransferase [Myxococcota bacterium]